MLRHDRPASLVALSLVLATTACASASQQQPEPRPTAYMGATLVDGTGAAPIEDAALIVDDGHVVCAGPRADCAVPAGSEIVDVSGRWITPGLIDAHVHFAQTAWADGRPDGMSVTDEYPYAEVVAHQRDEVATAYRSYLCSGVTGVFDVGGFPWSWALRDDAEQGVRIDAGDAALAPPHVSAAGPLLTWVPPPMSLPAEQVMVQIHDPEEARHAVDYVAANDSDAVKIWFLGVRPGNEGSGTEQVDAWVQAAGEEAAARDVPLIVHATSLREAKVAVRAGAHLLVHSVEDRPVDDEFLQLAREQGTIYTPTLTVGENWWQMSRSAFTGQEPAIDDPNGCVDPDTRAKILSTTEYADHPRIQRLTEEMVASRDEGLTRERETMAANLRRVHEAGIPIAMGTDAGNPLTVHGPSVYAEMERMQEAGLAAADIVVMATRNGARAMGREDEIGTLEPGKVADFLVLTEDPTADVSAFRGVTRVFRAGVGAPVSELSFRR